VALLFSARHGYPIHYYRTGISAVHIGQWITENANSPYINSDFDFWMLFQQPSYINLKLMISDRNILSQLATQTGEATVKKSWQLLVL
jgi:hypothetical protein